MKIAHRSARFAVAAAQMALADAAWPESGSRDDLGVVMGTSGFDPQLDDLALALGPDPDARTATDIPFFADRILGGLNPLWLLIGLPNMASAQLAIQLEARGPNNTVMTDWIAGSQAIGEAMLLIQSGEARAVLAGGADTALFPYVYASYDQAGLLGRGMVPGEGAAVFLLEDRGHAVARGAPIVAELRGFASGAGPGALAHTMSAALLQAGAAPSDVGVLSLGAVPDDLAAASEEQAVREVMGTRAAHVPRVEFKSRLGHALAAAGAIDMAIVLRRHGAPNGGTMLCNATGYGGQAATLVLSAG